MSTKAAVPTVVVPNDAGYPIGNNVIIRTVTMIYTGVLVRVTERDFVLVNASWIPDTERYMSFVAKGDVRECEPYPDLMEVFVSRGAYVDMCQLLGKLPREQK